MLQTFTPKTAKHDAPQPGAAPSLTSVEISWSVRTITIDDQSQVALTGNIDDHAQLIWRLEHLNRKSAKATAALITFAGSAERSVTVVQRIIPAGAILFENELIHIELAPALCATLRIDLSAATSSQLLYAKTNIFAQLGLPGAMYEPVGVQVDSATPLVSS